MEIGVTMYSFNHWARMGKIDVKGFIEFCSTVKDIRAVDLLSYYWKDEGKEKLFVSKLLDDHGLKLASYAIGSNFAHADKAVLQDQIDKAKKGIDMAAELGAPCLRIFGGSVEKGDDRYHDPRWGVWGTTLSKDTARDHVLKIVADALARLVGYSKDRKIVLALENHGGIPATADEIETLLKAVKSPYLKLTLDTGNFLTVGVDPVAEFRRTAKDAFHVHLKDEKKAPAGSSNEYEMCAIGDGVVDVAGCVRALKAAGYDRYLSIEFEGPEDPMEAVKKSVAATKRILANL